MGDYILGKPRGQNLIRAYKERLYPTKAQASALRSWLVRLCALYNAALQERRDAWRKQRKGITLYAQQNQLPAVRLDEDYAKIPIMALRGALNRCDHAFKAFFRRCKNGEKPGFPRFRARGRYCTIEIDDLNKQNPIVAGGKRIKIPLLGKIRFKQSRPIEGTPKCLRITLDATGRWWVVIVCADVPKKPLFLSKREVGVDLGLNHLAVTSRGRFYANARPTRTARIELERAQRRVSRRKKGSNRRKAAVRILARHHQKIANVRREHILRCAGSLIKNFGVIYVEDLNIKGLAKGFLAKSVNDASWGAFVRWLNVKAESAGREVVAVDPKGTSQICSKCGVAVHKGLGQRTHNCPNCGLTLDRDHNAAINILRRGQRQRRGAPVVNGLLRPANVERQAGLGLASI